MLTCVVQTRDGVGYLLAPQIHASRSEDGYLVRGVLANDVDWSKWLHRLCRKSKNSCICGNWMLLSPFDNFFVVE